MDWLRLSQHSRVTSSGEGGENMGANCAAKTLAVARCVSAWLHLKLKTLIPKRQADLKGNHKLPKKASCAFRSFVVDGFVLTHTRLKLATCKQWYYSTECVYYMIIYIYILCIWISALFSPSTHDDFRSQTLVLERVNRSSWPGAVRLLNYNWYFDQIWQLIQASISIWTMAMCNAVDVQ